MARPNSEKGMTFWGNQNYGLMSSLLDGKQEPQGLFRSLVPDFNSGLFAMVEPKPADYGNTSRRLLDNDSGYLRPQGLLQGIMRGNSPLKPLDFMINGMFAATEPRLADYAMMSKNSSTWDNITNTNGNQVLLFDGKKLLLFEDGNPTMSWNGVSGRPGY